MLLCITFVPVSAEQTTPIIPNAWPGRPGGNGDGSEEWLQGSYGETNGPFKLISTYKGETSELNNYRTAANSVGLATISILSGGILPGTAAIVKDIGLTAVDIGTSICGSYKGAYYIAKTYISGRCMKTVIDTYSNSNYTGYVATYEKYTKW